MVQPNFLIIGAQKCGTTSLWQALREHPGIHVANEKELNYFSDFKIEYKTVEWYEGNFIPEDDALFSGEFNPSSTPVGEAAPNYIFHPEAARNMYNYNPNFKLIVILRDPVRRAISQYHWEVRMANEKLSLGEAIDAEEERLKLPQNQATFGYKARGKYLEQLDRLFRFFSHDQVLIMAFRDLSLTPAPFVDYVVNFIGAPKWDGYTFTHVLKNEYPIPDRQDVVKLSEYFREYNSALTVRYGIDVGGWT